MAYPNYSPVARQGATTFSTVVEGQLGIWRIDARFAPPVRLSGTVEAIVQGDENAETEVVVKVGHVHIIVTKKRKPYRMEIDFTRLGLAPRKTDIVVVKIGYLFSSGAL